MTQTFPSLAVAPAAELFVARPELVLKGLAACTSGVSESEVHRLTRTLARLEPAASLALNAVALTVASGTAIITFAQMLIVLSDD